MKNWMFCLLSFLPFYLLAIPSPLPNDVKAIDEEIQILKSRLNSNRVEEMNEEVDGQGLMIGNWGGYAKDLEHIHQLEEDDKQTVQKIKILEERKANLIKLQTPPKQ